MQQICSQNNNNCPRPNNAYREILDDFETEVLDHQDKKNVQHFFNTVFNDVIVRLLDPKLLEMMKVDRTDPSFIFCFLQSVNTNYLNHMQKKNGKLVTKIIYASCA